MDIPVRLNSHNYVLNETYKFVINPVTCRFHIRYSLPSSSAICPIKQLDRSIEDISKHLCRIDGPLKNVISVFLPGLGYHLHICNFVEVVIMARTK